jgi:hypothetical protein
MIVKLPKRKKGSEVFSIIKQGKKNYQTMPAEGIANRKNSLMLRKTSFENRARVFSQAEEYFMYNPSKKTLNQNDKLMANAAPTLPKFNLKTRAQEMGIWRHRVAHEVKSIGRIML